MSEPPILPQPQVAATNADNNPFAPISAGVRRDPRIGQVELSLAFWCLIVFIAMLSIVAILEGYFVGWGALITIAVAAVRVPLLQRYHPRFYPHRKLSGSVALLITSWVLAMVFAFVACITFVVICVPTTIAFGASPALGLNVIMSISGAAACICFCALLYLSLRLPF